MKPLTQDIVLTHFDHQRLQGMLQMFRKRAAVNPSTLDALELELRRARTVAVDAIPSDVITMNSRIVLRDLVTGERIMLTLVFPDALGRGGDRISVLSPAGLAMLGCRVGDRFERLGAFSRNPLRIEEVSYQPEAKGNFFM